MIALTCGYTEAAAEVSTEFHNIKISPVSARRSAANYAVTIDGVRNIWYLNLDEMKLSISIDNLLFYPHYDKVLDLVE